MGEREGEELSLGAGWKGCCGHTENLGIEVSLKDVWGGGAVSFPVHLLLSWPPILHFLIYLSGTLGACIIIIPICWKGNNHKDLNDLF